MGTRYHITLIASPSTPLQEFQLKALKTKVDSLLLTINKQMSTYQVYSEISQFNQFNSTEWFSVSPAFAHIVKTSQEMCLFTNGAFDITSGSLVSLWGFGPEYEDAIPSTALIKTALLHTGYHLLDSRLNPPSLKKLRTTVSIDLSAIAKGYAVDQLSHLLINHGFNNHLVEIGGELKASGQNNGIPWKVGINIPSTFDKVYKKPLALSNNEGIATSGDYNNYFKKSGKRYSHTIDPATGKPITHNLASVTVVANSSMRADSLATALMVMGEVKGKQFVQEKKLKVFMLIRNTDDSYSTWNTFEAFD